MDMTTRRPRMAAAVVGAAVAIGWVLAGCGGQPEQVPPSPSGTPSGGVPVFGADQTPTAGPDGQGGGEQGGGGQGGGQSGGGQDSGSQQTGPQIETFRVTQQPQCPGGTDVNPIPAQPVVLEWRVLAADEVTLSIDGPGVYASYPAEGSDTFAFGCSGSEGDIQRHTYLLTATGDGQTATKELVVEAVVHKVTPV